MNNILSYPEIRNALAHAYGSAIFNASVAGPSTIPHTLTYHLRSNSLIFSLALASHAVIYAFNFIFVRNAGSAGALLI